MKKQDKKPEPKKEKTTGPDTSNVKLDDAGRFELDDKQLGEVSGGAMAILKVCCKTVQGCTIKTC